MFFQKQGGKNQAQDILLFYFTNIKENPWRNTKHFHT